MAAECPTTNMVPPLKMVAAPLYLPKDNNQYLSGQDAHFVDAVTQTIGVADGVGGWSKHGIDAGNYARNLIENSVVALREKNPDSGHVINPKSIIEAAFRLTTEPGSSTACIVTLSGDNVLRAANVGDSGFLVIRDGAVSYRSPIQQKRFNAPFQLGATGNNPSVAEEIELRAEKGDIVVLGTDGLFDNVHAHEILEIVCQGVKEWRDVMEMCRSVAERAYNNSYEANKDTPFSIGAREAGKTSYRGGKVDDITVVVARIHDDEEAAMIEQQSISMFL